MPDRTRIDAAIAELGAAINEALAPVAPEAPPVAPYAKFKDFPPFQVQECTLHLDTNVVGLQYVLFADNAKNTWYEDSKNTVPAGKAFTIKARTTGDRVKVFNDDFSIVVDSLPFLFAEASPVPVVLPQPKGDAASTVAALLKQAGNGGINVERELAAEFSQDDHNYLRKQVPFPAGRNFLAWRPQGGFAFNENQSWQPPSDNAISRFVDGLVRMKKAGYRVVFADCADVCDDTDQSDRGIALIKQSCVKVANAVKQRSDLGPDFLILGAINENATSQQRVLQVQDDLLGTLRAILPNHVLSYGCDYWKYWGKLIEGTGFKVPRDELTVCDTHSYTAMDAAGWNWLAGELSKWQQRTGRRVVYGEAGLDDLNRGRDYGLYADHARTMLPIMRPFVPMPWAVNKGNEWRLNYNGAELVNKQAYPNGGNAPDIGDALKQGLGL